MCGSELPTAAMGWTQDLRRDTPGKDLGPHVNIDARVYAARS